MVRFRDTGVEHLQVGHNFSLSASSGCCLRLLRGTGQRGSYVRPMASSGHGDLAKGYADACTLESVGRRAGSVQLLQRATGPFSELHSHARASNTHALSRAAGTDRAAQDENADTDARREMHIRGDAPVLLPTDTRPRARARLRGEGSFYSSLRRAGPS